MIKKITLFLTIFSSLGAILASSFAIANEGMWQPHQLPSISKELKAAGLELNPEDLTDLTGFPMGAIVSLGGCTASFVSAKGLVASNHHCVYGSVQYNSTEENNLLKDGFLAKTFKDELPATPGSRIYVTEDIREVTRQVSGELTDAMSGTERFKTIDSNSKQLVAECEKDDKYRCRVVNFHGGLEYFLFKQLMIRDVRLVHAPATSIGKFGGDIDNWMWPRHTGDYGFYRAYVGKDGQPADFSVDNVPYEPKHFLKVNAKGVEEDDYIMVIGYPGRTSRYRTSTEVKNTFTENYKLTKELMGSIIDSIKSNSDEGSDTRIKYESLIAGLANYEKNRGSMMESYNKGTTQQRKNELEKSLRTWINKKNSRKKKYNLAMTELDKLVKQSHHSFKRDTILGYVSISSMMSSASRLYRLALENEKPDMERESGYQERDLNRFKQAMKRIDRRYDAKVDQAILMNLLTRYANLPMDEHVSELDSFFKLDDGFSESRLDKQLTKMYAKTQLGTEETRLEWMSKTVAEFEASDDPFIQYAVATYQARKQLEDESKNLSGNLNAVRPKYMEAIIAYNKAKNNPIYADANSTLRITYGNVKGYSPKDGLTATPFTTLEGIAAKHTGADPFDSPQKQLDLIAKKDYGKYLKKDLGSVPVNFLGTLDITGGNSGSPTLNARAEFVGLVFDGVYESIIGDWDYDNQLNRSISVDSRYILWVMEHVDGATNLINEMEVIR
jgi:hypothetical protein